MKYSLQATYYRTALLLGIVRGDLVKNWADEIIERDPEPPPAFFDLVTVRAHDLSALRLALWPIVIVEGWLDQFAESSIVTMRSTTDG